MPPTTKEKLIRSAHDLFYREGFHVVGVDRIIAEVGVTKTTFYNHFPSKDDLIAEVLRWHDGWWQETFRRMLRRHGGDRPREQLLAIPEALAETFRASPFNGCLFVNVAVQFPMPHDPAHQAAVTHKAAMEDLLRELAGYARAPDAAALAKELSLILEGAYVTLQVSGDAAAIDVARRLVRLVIERHLGAE